MMCGGASTAPCLFARRLAPPHLHRSRPLTSRLSPSPLTTRHEQVTRERPVRCHSLPSLRDALADLGPGPSRSTSSRGPHRPTLFHSSPPRPPSFPEPDPNPAAEGAAGPSAPRGQRRKKADDSDSDFSADYASDSSSSGSDSPPRKRTSGMLS